MRPETKRHPLPICLLAGLCWLALFSTHRASAAQDSAPPKLTFDELIQLSRPEPLDPSLQDKLKTVLTTPVVRNRAPGETTPSAAALRVTEWNIERGEQLESIEQVLQSPEALPEALMERAGAGKKLSKATLLQLRGEAEVLRQSDVLILNEVDIGVKRTDYRNVVDELAKVLGMNSAYAVEFVEVDALTALGTEAAVLDTKALSERMTEDLRPDRSRYKGLHVNAILSRYPLENARVISLPVCHDWFARETEEISQLEKAKRKAANLVFLERIAREVRRGNRNALASDVMVPGAGAVEVVNAHLENKCKAECRNRQMTRILEEVGSTTGPVVIAGDLNTTGTDGSPTSVRYELSTRLKDYQFWVGQLLRFTPVGLPVYATAPFSFWKNFRDPTALHIPVIGKNPEAQLFSTVRQFKFAGGGRFDFEGQRTRNLQKSSRTLSDSNERAGKGFVPTFSMQRDFGGLMKYRLDWIFVKPGTGEGDALLPPQMPRTLSELNGVIPERLSDHAPITVELPRR